MARSPFVILQFLLIFTESHAENKTFTVLHLVETQNKIAVSTFEAAVKYLISTGLKVNVQTVSGSDDYTFLTAVCTSYSQMVDSGNPPDLVMDNSLSGLVSAAVKSFTASVRIPTMSTSYGQEGDLRQWNFLNETELRNFIQIIPPRDLIPFVTRAIILNQNYSTAAILSDVNYVMDYKYKCLLENVAARHIIADMDTNNPINQLIHIKKVKIFNIFLLGNARNVKLFLDGADAISMFTKDFSWHVITDESDFSRCECREAKIIYARPVMNPKYQTRLDFIKKQYDLQASSDIITGYFFDLSLRSMLAAKRMMDDFNGEMKYIKCEEFNGTNSPTRGNMMNLTKSFLEEFIEPSFGLFNVSKNGFSSMDFEMELQGMQFREGTILNRTILGIWRAGYDNLVQYTNPELMNDYKSITYYRITAIAQKPFLFYDEKAPKKYSGYCIDLIDNIAEMMSFDYEISEVVDGETGARNENGEWNGIIRELKDGRADIGLGAISVTEERKNVVEFTVPIYDLVGHTILMKVPQEKSSLFRFINIFDSSVWLVLILFYVATSLIQWVLYKLSPYGYTDRMPNDRRRLFDLKECFWFSLVCFTPQGAGEAPANWSARITTAAWWFFVFIMFSSYSANLSAFLTVSRLEVPIKSLNDLASQYKIQYAPVNNSLTMKYFQQMADIEKRLYQKWLEMNVMENCSDYQRASYSVFDYPLSDKFTKLWNMMKRAGLPNSIEEALDRVKKSPSVTEGFALLGDATDIRYFVMANCDYQMVGEEFYKKSYAVATPKGSPLTDQLSTAILQLFNQRTMETLKEKWWDHNPDVMHCEEIDLSGSIGINNIGGVFIFLGVAMFLYFLVSAVIYCFSRLFKGKLNRIGIK